MADQAVAVETPPTDWLSAQDVADKLGIHKCTLATWRKKGEGPRFYRFSKTDIRYAPEDVDAWVASVRQ